MLYGNKINFGKYIFLHFLILRILSVWTVKTWYVPDEYWQSLEVAHRLVFGYGYLTWEWRKGLRSYIHPLLVAFIYKILALLNLDTAYLVVCITGCFNLMVMCIHNFNCETFISATDCIRFYKNKKVTAPRIAQAVLSAYSDYCFYKWTGRKKWAVFCITTQWFWFYMASRTLINTFETSLTTIALSLFPWKGSKNESTESTSFLWIVAFLTMLRPTAAIIWLPLCLFHLYLQKSNWTVLIFTRYLPIGLIALTITIFLDSLCYGFLVITPWEFLKINVFYEIGSFYGTLPWHWYFTAGFPTILGVHLIPFVWSSIKIIQQSSVKINQMAILGTILFTLIIYSLLPHKEFRFILPLIPMALYISVDYLSPWSTRANRLHIWLVAITLFTASSAPIYYLSNVHQRGTLELMPILQKIASERPNDTYILFLMPCHSTPLYSHLHVNVKTRFLTCEPNFSNVTNYKSEADMFYENPVQWIAENYPSESELPTHIIAFDHLDPSNSIFKRYKQLHTLRYTQVASGFIGHNLIVYQIDTY